MRKTILLMLSICCLYSCTRKYESSTPKDLINKQQMEDILVEVYMTEASIRNCIITNQMDSLEIWTAQQMNAILDKNKVSYTRFVNNYNYYMGHEELAKDLMEQVVNRLVKMETEATIEVQKSRKQTTPNLKNIKSEVKTIELKNKK